MKELCRNPRKPRGLMWMQFKMTVSLQRPHLDMLYFGCHRTGMPGGPGSILCLKIFFPPVLPPQYLGCQLPRNVFGVWSNQGYCSCRLYDGMICWARSLGPNNFLIKSTSYLSSCVPIPSWAVSDFFFFNLAKPCGMCDISFPTRDWTWAPCTGRQEF